MRSIWRRAVVTSNDVCRANVMDERRESRHTLPITPHYVINKTTCIDLNLDDAGGPHLFTLNNLPYLMFFHALKS